MDERIELAREGRLFWLGLIERYQIDNAFQVILLPDQGQIYWKPALKYLPKYLKKKHAKRGIVLTSQKELVQTQSKRNHDIVFALCKSEELLQLMQFYCLYEFTSNFVIASLEEPAGRMGTGMIGQKGLSLEEVFAGVVYGLVDEEA